MLDVSLNMVAMLPLAFVALLSCLDIGYASRVCQWKDPRAAVIRDTLYLDGGQIWAADFDPSTKTWSGTPGNSNLQGTGIVFKLYFNTSFKISDDFLHLFVNDTGAGILDDNPPFRSGFMFADDYEYYTFGGISLGSEGLDANLSNYQIYDPVGQVPQTPTVWRGGCNTHYMPSPGINRYITHGAGANIPSEYLGFYYSGLQTPTGDYIQENKDTDSLIARGGLIKVDMSSMGDAVWTNLSSATAAGVADRGGAALSWVPFGEQGLLVLTGGVPNPLNIDIYGTSSTSPTNLMEQLSVYDVANNVWYSQSTTGDSPPQLAEFCAVVAHEENSTSYQIHIYGGFNGMTQEASSSVWILSLPSFQWKEKQYPTTDTDAGRYGHTCAMPYPDQMIVVGGLGTFGDAALLPRGEIVQVLNLSSLEWMQGYDPKKYYPYHIPDIVNSTDPGQLANGMDIGLANLFNTPQLNTGTTYYPYVAHSSKMNHWAIIGGVIGGVAVVVAATAFLIWFFCRRKRSHKSDRSSSVPATSETQVTRSHDGVENWRNQVVKSIASSGILEIASSDRSTVNNDPVEVAGVERTYLHSPRSPRSPHLPAGVLTPGSPQSGSVEVSGDPSLRQEMQDTSPHHGSLHNMPSMAQQPDYRFRNHPLFPLNVNDTMSVSESALTSGPGQVSSVDTEHPNTTMMSYRAGPLGADDPFNQVLYGRVPPVPPKQPVVGTSEVANLRHQPSTGRMPYEDIYPGDALPSPVAKELRTTRPTVRGGLRTFQIMPSEMGPQSPLTHGPAPTNTPTNQVPPGMHQRTVSDESAVTIELPPSPDQLPPSPSPAENHRRSKILDSMPERPAQASDSTATWPQQTSSPWQAGSATHLRVVPPTNTAATRRKEVGSPVRSAYEENSSRFQGH